MNHHWLGTECWLHQFRQWPTNQRIGALPASQLTNVTLLDVTPLVQNSLVGAGHGHNLKGVTPAHQAMTLTEVSQKLILAPGPSFTLLVTPGPCNILQSSCENLAAASLNRSLWFWNQWASSKMAACCEGLVTKWDKRLQPDLTFPKQSSPIAKMNVVRQFCSA